MKKRYDLSLKDVAQIEIADVMATLWIVGLFLMYSPVRTVQILNDWKWAFFVIAVIIGIKPLSRMLYGEKSIAGEARPKATNKKSKWRSVKK